jgi:bifunctional non-homologous end joining protein LigD
MVAFDLLYLNGRDLRKVPLLQRKAELNKIIAGTDIQFSEASRSTARRYSSTPAKSA